MLKGAELKEALEELKGKSHALTEYEDIVVSTGETNPSKSGRNLVETCHLHLSNLSERKLTNQQSTVNQ